jgi:hypothetical protein
MHPERKIRNLEVEREDHRGRIDRLTATLRE